ncbi:hypothetical protein DL546_008183 [Coniochaeta pulveracea]|uniref:Cerato-platanin n=1 Tax=Coniochaeta pulveracea TaxID=177199 RepID=A0A420YMV7_9PEZI|nr:hypothetical protein DL546_008183 [Coniochaeta pulveracea]
MFLSALFTLSTAILGATAYQISGNPHDSYSSSVGVLGCHIDTNRVAYFPQAVDCNNICVRVSANGRSVNLLRIDQSGGAYDMSYDAWNYLVTGQSATAHPVAGGGVTMDVQDVDVSECFGLLHTAGSKLPLSASNSMNYLSNCISQNSWVGKNTVLYNIQDAQCRYGIDETCGIPNFAAGINQATCPHQLGVATPLHSPPVCDIKYPTGQTVCVNA